MAAFIIGYGLIALVILFVTFSILVKKKILFGNTIAVQRIFANPLLHYSLKRILSSLISIALAMLVTFFLIRIARPANESCARLFNDPKVPAAVKQLQCDTWKESMGLSGSIFEQLIRFIYSLIPIPKLVCVTTYDIIGGSYKAIISDCKTVIFDLGRIYEMGVPPDGTLVTDFMFERMGVSFRITIFAVILELALGYPFGILMAKYQNGIFDKIGKGYIMIVDAIPGLAYYYLWMVLLCYVFKLPSHFDTEKGPVYLVLSSLPAILTMSFAGMSGIGLWVRRYMVDEFNSDYVKFARSKGLSENRIMGIHILRNAVVPLARTFPSAIIGALMGSYFIERMYGIDGIGRTLTTAVQNAVPNVWLIQGLILFSAFLSVLSYLLGDIVTAAVDPRISFEA